MTCREKLAKEHPDLVSCEYLGGCYGCPGNDDFLYIPGAREDGLKCLGPTKENCRKCWDQEVGGAEATETSALYADNMQIDIHKIINEAMEKKDRCVSIYISESGVSVTVTPLEEPSHWERIILGDNSLFGTVRYRCSHCKTQQNYTSRYCPACGEEMHGYKEVKE